MSKSKTNKTFVSLSPNGPGGQELYLVFELVNEDEKFINTEIHLSCYSKSATITSASVTSKSLREAADELEKLENIINIPKKI